MLSSPCRFLACLLSRSLIYSPSRSRLFRALLLGLAYPALAHPALAQKTAGNTLTVNTRLIYVDVVVHDNYGRPVPGLAKTDFSVREDGKPQSVVFFQENPTTAPHEASSPASLPAGEPAGPATPGEHSFSNVPGTQNSDPAGTILLLDLLNTPIEDQLYGVRQLIAFCRRMPAGHRVALFVLGDRLRMLQGFTGSSDQLLAAANRVRPEDSQLLRGQAEGMQMEDLVNSFAKAIGPSPGGAADRMLAALHREDDQGLVRRFRLTAAAFQQIARASAGYPGRKNLVWLASNFPVGVGAQLQVDRSTEALDLLDTGNLVGNLQVAIYPVRLAGLQTEGVPAAANGAGTVSLVGGPVGSLLNPQGNQAFEQQFVMRNSGYYAMNDLARDTGGRAFHGSNDIAGGVTWALEDGAHYYTLAYHPSTLKWDGSYRQIRVTLPTGGYQLAYRRGYLASPPPDGTRYADQELAAALQPDMLDSSQLRLRADLSARPGSPTLAVSVTLDARDLSFAVDGAGHRHTQLLVVLATLPHGDKETGIVPPQAQTVLNLDLSPAQYAALLQTGVHFGEQVPARFASTPLRLGVIETNSHRLGTLELPATQQAMTHGNPSH